MGINKKHVRFLAFVFLLYIGIRSIPFFFIYHNPDRFFDPDSYEYNKLGINILTKGTYTLNQDEIGLKRTPAYPVYLALIYKFFGIKPAVALAFQIIISGFIPILLYLNADLLFSKRTAKTSAVISIFEPVSIVYANILFSETLFVIFVLLSTYFFIKSVKSYHINFVIASAFFCGISAYFRAITIYAMLVFGLLYFIGSWLGKKEKIKSAVLYVFVSIIVITPWIMRNYSTYNYVGFCGIQDFNLYFFRAAGVISVAQGITEKQAQADLINLVPRGLSLKDRYEFYRKHAIHIVLDHPFSYLVAMFKGSLNMLIAPERYQVFRLTGIKLRQLGFMWQGKGFKQMVRNLLGDPPLIIISTAYQMFFTGILGIFDIIGIFLLIKRGYCKQLMFFFFIIGYFVILAAGPEAEPRFRLPILPYQIMLASFAILSLFDMLQLTKKKNQRGQIFPGC